MLRFVRCLLAASLIGLCRPASSSALDLSIAEMERLRNTPPELKSIDSEAESQDQAQARFLPFSASFSLSAGDNHAHSFSIAGGPGGIGLSQSATHGSGSGANGNPGSFSTSHSSSIAAGPAGVSAADSNSFASNNPHFGPSSQAHGNSFGLGEASAAAHGDVVNGHATSGAQSSVGGAHTQASSGAQSSGGGGHAHASSGAQSLAQSRPGRPHGWTEERPVYEFGNNDEYYQEPRGPLPSLKVEVSEGGTQHAAAQPSNGWYPVTGREPRQPWYHPNCRHYEGYQDPRCRLPRVTVTRPGGGPPQHARPHYYGSPRDPRQDGIKIYAPAATSSASSMAQSSGAGGIASSQASSQTDSSDHGPFSSLTSNHIGSSAKAEAHSEINAIPVHQHNHGLPQTSSTSATANTHGSGSAKASAEASSSADSRIVFPGPSSHQQFIPREFVRTNKPKEGEDPIESLIEDFTDAVSEILDY